MKQLEPSTFSIMAAGLLWPAAALAEEAAKAPAGGYAAGDYVWFTLIGLILVYGVYDSFFKAS
ncbi:MAG: hypothetical protein FJ249_01400 [Nitrospira sp.]|nr:hypothetical protein [Nitrospira sp.]